MRCPVDDTPLAISDRQGIEIGYCPDCRGVWLDRGELDKLIERSSAYTAPPPAPDRGRDRDDDRKPKKKKRESFLTEIFELGG